MISKYWIYLIIVVGLVATGFTIRGVIGEHEAIVKEKVADAIQAQVKVHEEAIKQAQADIDNAKKATQAAQDAADAKDASVRGLKQDLAKTRAALDAARNAHPEQPVDLSPLVAKQDAVIKAQDERHDADLKVISDKDVQITTIQTYGSEQKKRGDLLEKENTLLRSSLTNALTSRSAWAAGATYGDHNTKGAWGSYDWGPIRVGVQVLRESLSGGNYQTEALANVGWRF